MIQIWQIEVEKCTVCWAQAAPKALVVVINLAFVWLVGDMINFPNVWRILKGLHHLWGQAISSTPSFV